MNQKRTYLQFSLLIFLFALQLSADKPTPSNGYTHLPCEIIPLARRDQSRGTRPHLPFKQGTSTNWSGYVAASNIAAPGTNTVTKVNGSWTVPALSPSTNHTWCSLWVGIDGFSSNSVEQIGTEHDWVNGRQQNYAWFEMYPEYPYEITGFPCNVGDVMKASVEYVGNNQFKLTIINDTRRVYIIIPPQYTRSSTARRSSAEWVVEAPYGNAVLPLSHFNPVRFTACQAIIRNLSRTIGKLSHDSLTMITPNRVTKALPSALTPAGDGFTVSWHHE